LIPLDQAAIYWAVAVVFIWLSLRWSRREMDEVKVPMFAALAAGIFAIQAINIPIPWGTSGHMLGSVMAAIILGSPYAGVLLLALVLLVQGFLFGDGGISVMGANMLDMGVLASFTGYYTYQALKSRAGMTWAAFAGGWVGLFVSALAVAVQLAAAGTFPLVPALIWMGTYHAVIGVVAEGTVTAIVLKSLMHTRPELISPGSRAGTQRMPPADSGVKRNTALAAGAAIVLVALALAVLAPFIASSDPDGLEKVIIQLAGRIDDPVGYGAPFADYGISGMGKAGEVAAVLAGTVLAVAAALGIQRVMKRGGAHSGMAVKGSVGSGWDGSAPIIEVRGLRHTYHDSKRPALEGIDLIIQKGERLVILGANGSGKSTLIKHLNGILLPHSGEVLVKGMPVAKSSLRDVRRTVGVVFQNPDDQVFLPEVRQDVAFGPINMGLPGDVVEQRVTAALRSVGLDGLHDRSPHHMSGGEKKRVAIAGVLAMEPEVMVLDEPTAGLDPDGRHRILRLIYNLNKKLGITVVIATHDVDMVPVFTDRVVVLSAGKKIADGAPTEIFSDPHVLRQSNLHLPIVTRLLNGLQNAGMPVKTRLTVEGAKKEIMRVFRGT
ncbi:MAG TPA: cobalt transporter CbiM, partial [Candidatus Methanoperedenaceae archaeon]|nr:cobalt transporter CbiM [Candidatus Methanoperedenaceae archaeon]